MKSKTALVTGINGFTGRYMKAELEGAGYEVIGIGTSPSAEPGYRQADLSDLHALKGIVREEKPDVVIHLAAIASVAHDDANALYNVNLLGARNLLEALTAAQVNPTCIIMASSANVYGNASRAILTEDTPPAPANDYAVSKLAMEHMARLYSARLPIVITRPFNYSGVGQAQNFLIPKIVSHFRAKARVIELGNLDVWRDFGDVRSVVQTYRLLLGTPLAIGQTLNVCSGQVYSLREILSLCESLTDHTIEVRVNPAFVRENEVRTLRGDANRLNSLIGSRDTYTLEDTLRWMLTA